MSGAGRAELEALARRFPERLVEAQLIDLPRVAFELELVLERKGADVALCDVGSGVGLFPAACAQAGMRVTMMDDFAPPFADEESARAVPDAPDAVNFGGVEVALDLHRSLGVSVEKRDPLAEGFGFGAETFDVVTIFDSMEHWHRSPKRLFAEIREALTPGGLFVVGGPNCVNLRKRVTVPLGRGKWSEMAHWYEPEYFRGHVREPDVGDLHYVARDMGLTGVEIFGRNRAGDLSDRRAVRALTAIIDPVLQLRPSLCSDIYLVARKPE
ncbi:MAG: class I SAM-dependent methyltransferase [Myxococcota bacterium]